MRSIQTKQHIVKGQLRQVGTCVENTIARRTSTASSSQHLTPQRACTPPVKLALRSQMNSAPHMSESKIQGLSSKTGTRGFSKFRPKAGIHTQIREKEPDTDPTVSHALNDQAQQDNKKKQQKAKQDLKLRTQLYLKESKILQNNFEIESQSAESSEENEANHDFAHNEYESDILNRQTKSSQDFIDIYKNQYGMPQSEGNETDVKDYLFKLLEYKFGSFSSDELSSEDNLIKREAKKFQQEIENDSRNVDQTKTAKNESSPNIAFKKLSNNKGFLVMKKSEDLCSYKVVFVRHGQSIWNKDGRCSGWMDVPLNEKGKQEAHQAGQLLRDLGYKFDLAYTSYLSRAYETNMIILNELRNADIMVNRAWQINERHYGALEGQYKTELEKEFGTQQVKLWRQSYDHPPPQITYDHEQHPRFDKLYSNLSQKEQRQLPLGESLEMVNQRIQPYWEERIVPHLMSMGRDKVMLFTAHQHVCRGLVKVLTDADNEAILGLRIPNASPFVFEFDKNMRPLRNYYADNEDVEVMESTKIETKETLFMHGR